MKVFTMYNIKAFFLRHTGRIHLEFTLVRHVMGQSSSSCGLTRHTSWKDPSPQHCTATCIRNARGVGLPAGLHCAHWCAGSALTPPLHCCLTYYSLITGLDSSFFFQDCRGYSRPNAFLYKFQNQLTSITHLSLLFLPYTLSLRKLPEVYTGGERNYSSIELTSLQYCIFHL